MSIRNSLPATIKTQRLTLRAPVMADLGAIVALLGNWNVVAATAAIPFPYGDDEGRQFLSTLDQPELPRNYAIANSDDLLIGIIGLKCPADEPPELGYWLGEPFWGQGFVSEAAAGLLQAVDGTGEVSQMRARALSSNTASIRVLEKCGFSITGRTTSVIERHLGQRVVILHRSAR